MTDTIQNLAKGWRVIQDVHELGETFSIFKEGFDPRRFGGEPGLQPMAPWQPIDRLEHLQLTLADNPYFGFGLRQFNAAPWWYEQVFVCESEASGAWLEFAGVDYFADVWLNGEYLGSHEGYGTSFGFDVGDKLRRGEKNRLIVKVRAPWENNIRPGEEYIRFLSVIRDQMKGTYEHSDTFVPRDVNPIGIWDKVTVHYYEPLRLGANPMLRATLSDDYSSGLLETEYILYSLRTVPKALIRLEVRLIGEVAETVTAEMNMSLKAGANKFEKAITVDNPRLWTIWERGEAARYEAVLTVMQEDEILLYDCRTFGFRRIELIRNSEKTQFFLNGEPIYIRGSTYFPDAYISAMSRQRYIRDLDNARMAGMNSLRIHVHTEREEFYDLCDERGILLIQDSDFNWVHPTDDAWNARALKMYGEMLARLRNHPSIFCWVLLNEPRNERYLKEAPGPQMMEMTERMDPGRPYILSSWDIHDPHSGDSHNYEGSLHGAHTHYLNIYDWKEKLNTEFGFDAPPVYGTLREEPELCRILGPVVDGIDDIQYYQYRYIKYFIEHYRIQKFDPCSGHYQFLFTDMAPTSLFGVYDRQGVPKYAQRAFAESNQPVGVFMEISKNGPVAVWAVNDLLEDYGEVTASWAITVDGTRVEKNRVDFRLAPNARVMVAPITLVPEEGADYLVELTLRDKSGRLLAKNRYERAFTAPMHTPGHPQFVHHGIGLRTYWAWMDQEA